MKIMVKENFLSKSIMKIKDYFKFKLYFLYSIFFVFFKFLGYYCIIRKLHWVWEYWYYVEEYQLCFHWYPWELYYSWINVWYSGICSIQKKKQEFGKFFVIIFLGHLIPFLALYPGLCIYDTGNQIYQYDVLEFNTKHPLIHTLAMDWFKNLFSEPNIGFLVLH